MFADSASIWEIGLLVNIVTISVSFLTYKLFVFKTSGNWWAEYLKAYVVYGTLALLSVFILWILVDVYKVTIWLAQGLLVIVTVIISYVGHSNITFKRHTVSVLNEKN